MREMAGLDEGTALFVQVAERLAAEIADGGLGEGERVPSTNELAAYYRINPATAAKGINVLAGEGLLEKHRGIGMFVAAGARRAAAGTAPYAVRRALRETPHRRGDSARHRHRRAGRAGPRVQPGPGRCNGMTPAISVAGLTRSYRGQLALDGVSFEVATGSITGLLGRNGAGKTTLLRILTGQEFPSAGGVRVFGASPAENDEVLRRMVFVREDQAYPDIKVRHALRAASWCYPNWSAELADRLWRTSPCRRTARSRSCPGECGRRWAS